jgi:hypothetical protein
MEVVLIERSVHMYTCIHVRVESDVFDDVN